MKKPLRIFLIVAGVCVLLLAVLVGLAFTPGVQTWAVRRALADVPGVTLDRVAIGLHSVHVENLRVNQPGLALVVPSADLALPVIAAARGNVQIAKLTAKGWTLDLTPAPGTPPAKTATAPFEGIFKSLQLPVDLALDAAELEGDVTRPEGRAHVTLTGGQLGAGRDASITLNAAVATPASGPTPAGTLAVKGTLSARMDTPRTFASVGLAADATATGGKLAQPVTTQLALKATRDAAGESYQLALTGGGKELARFALTQPAAATAPFAGTWALDARDSDLAPFALGTALPTFNATGAGTFAVSRDFKQITAVGKLNGTAEKLEVLQPELAALGRTEFAADFDVAQQGDVTRVTKLNVRLGGAQPTVAVEALQSFTFDAKTDLPTPSNPAADLAHITLNSVPLAWVQPFLTGVTIRTGMVSGTADATTSDGGFAVRVASLTANATIVSGGESWQIAALNIPAATASHSKAGWQAEIPLLSVRSPTPAAGTPTAVPAMALKNLRAGQLAGKGEPVKLAGDYELALPLLKSFSAVVAPYVTVSAGKAQGSFTAVLGDKKEIALKLQLAVLKTLAPEAPLADVSLDARADIAADGGITLNVPVVVTKDGRKSEFTVGGTVRPTKAGVVLDAQLAGETLYVEDVSPFSGLGAKNPAPASAPSAGPPWAGVGGTVKYAFKKVVFSPDYATSLTGTVKIENGAVALDTRGMLNTGSPFTLTGGVTHTPGAAEPYALKADVKLDNFDISPVLGKLEARVNLAAQLTGRAATLDALADRTQGKLQLASRGGVFRFLAVTDDKSGLVQTAASAGATLLGTAAGALFGGDAASKTAQVVMKLSELLREIRYDQLNVSLSRGAKLDWVLDDFTLIAPEVRLAGRGQVRHVEGQAVLDQPLTLQLAVAGRGSVGSLLQGAGLAGPADNLGYLPLALELPALGGTLNAPDTGAFYRKLAEIAALKGVDSVTKGAGSLLNGLLGK